MTKHNRCHPNCKAVRFKQGKLYKADMGLTLKSRNIKRMDYREEIHGFVTHEETIMLFVGYRKPDHEASPGDMQPSWGDGRKQRSDTVVDFLWGDKVLEFTGTRCTENFEEIKT